MYYRLKILSYITVVVFAFVFLWIEILKRRNDPAKICACVLVVVSFVWLAFETINDFSSAAERQRYYDLMTADSVVLESLIDGSVKKYALDQPESSDHFGLFLITEKLPERVTNVAKLTFYQGSHKIDSIMFSVMEVPYGQCCVSLGEERYGIFSSLSMLTKDYCYNFPDSFVKKYLGIMTELNHL